MGIWRKRGEETVGQRKSFESFFGNDEQVLGSIRVSGFHASQTPVYGKDLSAVLTNDRVCVVSSRKVEASWRWADMQPRTNSNQGTALGPMMYFVTLFADDGETMSFGFRNVSQREELKSLIHSTANPISPGPE